jgi:TetR/AcrR family transcriptional repressor of nem operon
MARERPGSPVRAAFTEGVEALANVMVTSVPDESDALSPRERALSLFAAMVGAVAIARAIDDEDFAKDILHSVRQLAAQP